MEQSIRQICVEEPTIDIVLDPASHQLVVNELANHFGGQLTQGGTGVTRLGGVNIIRGA